MCVCVCEDKVWSWYTLGFILFCFVFILFVLPACACMCLCDLCNLSLLVFYGRVCRNKSFYPATFTPKSHEIDIHMLACSLAPIMIYLNCKRKIKQERRGIRINSIKLFAKLLNHHTSKFIHWDLNWLHWLSVCTLSTTRVNRSECWTLQQSQWIQ